METEPKFNGKHKNKGANIKKRDAITQVEDEIEPNTPILTYIAEENIIIKEKEPKSEDYSDECDDESVFVG